MLMVTLFLTKQKSLLPTGGLQEHREENSGSKQNAKLPPQEQEAMGTGHARKGRERRKGITAEVAPKRESR